MKPSELCPRGIVVIDDAPANLVLLANILEDAGYEVRIANSGQRALTLILNHPPDLVLLDVNLGDKDGYQVCRELKSNEATSRIPVIFLSAEDSAEAKRLALAAGGAEYLVKPFEATDVLAKVMSHLVLSKASRDLGSLQTALADCHRRSETVFEALCATLPGAVLDATYELTTRGGEGGGVRFAAKVTGSGEMVTVEILAPREWPKAGLKADTGGSPSSFTVSSSGVPYRVHRDAPR